MKRLYQIEALVAATLYIKADTLEEAIAKAATVKGDALEVQDAGGEVPVSDLMFDDPELPEISFSPAMTVHHVDATGYLSEGPDEEGAE